MTEAAQPRSALQGIRVLDLSRVLAGPWCSQILGDLGADVIKIEQPGQGDDTRKWGPPFLDDGSHDSAYYLCANRNKQSIGVNIADPSGAEIVRKLAAKADIVIENFRVGGLAKYGLDYASIRELKPDIIWCSITGFGQNGPLSHMGGYDFLIQGMSGLMSVTGRPDNEPGGGPIKVGTPTSDLSTGLYAAISILAALHHRQATGEGQAIDCALLDTQVALLANQASNWLNGGVRPRRLGNQHPNMIPYQNFACADGEILIALGNDRQFAKFSRLLGMEHIAADPRFSLVSGRAIHRSELLAIIEPEIAKWQSEVLVESLRDAGLPAGRVNEVPDILQNPHIAARGLKKSILRNNETEINFLGFPAKLSETPASYRRPPPRCAADTIEVLRADLGLSDIEIAALRAQGSIEVQE